MNIDIGKLNDKHTAIHVPNFIMISRYLDLGGI